MDCDKRHGHKNDDSRRRRTEVESSSRIRQRLSQYESGEAIFRKRRKASGEITHWANAEIIDRYNLLIRGLWNYYSCAAYKKSEK